MCCKSFLNFPRYPPPWKSHLLPALLPPPKPLLPLFSHAPANVALLHPGESRNTPCCLMLHKPVYVQGRWDTLAQSRLQLSIVFFFLICTAVAACRGEGVFPNGVQANATSPCLVQKLPLCSLKLTLLPCPIPQTYVNIAGTFVSVQQQYNGRLRQIQRISPSFPSDPSMWV